MALERRSAVILPVPDAEPIVGRLRRLYDPSSRVGVPAHITLLVPFCPAPVPDDVVCEVERLLAGIGEVTIRFEDVGRFAHTLYLEPEPNAPLVSMTELIAARWPEWPPYGGIHQSVVPHLTVADHLDDEMLLQRIAAGLEPKLPLVTTLSEAWIIEEGADGLWRVRAVVSLSNAAEGPPRSDG